MRYLTSCFVAVLILVASAEPVRLHSQQVRTAGAATLTFRGYVSATLFGQDSQFGLGGGQNALWAAAPAPGDDPWVLSGDIRSTRLALDVTSPPVLGDWAPGATVEFDFFGGFRGADHLAEQQPLPRLRLAYAELRNDRTMIRVGQAWSPSYGYTPASLSHTAYPLGYGSAGGIGSYFPGIFVYRALTAPDGPTAVQLQVAAFRGSWEPPAGEPLEHRSAGEAGIPQLEARLDFTGRVRATPWGAYVVGHYDRKDLSGAGAAEADELVGSAIAVGVRAAPGPLTLQGSAYRGRAIGHLFGNLLQLGDIEGWGAWGQAGVGLTPRWSGWLFAGIDDPDSDDVAREIAGNGRLRNRKLGAMLRLSEGPFAVGLEWLSATTDWRIVGVAGATEVQRTANQIGASVMFTF